MSEGETVQNQIEGLEAGVQRRYVIGFDSSGKDVRGPLIVAHESRDSIPPKLNHQTLSLLGLGQPEGRKGGFCKREGEKLIWINEGPSLITSANEAEFKQALANGIKVIELPSE